MYTLATIFIFLVIGLSIYFQLTKNKKFNSKYKNKLVNKEDLNKFVNFLVNSLDQIGFLQPDHKRKSMIENIRTIFHKINLSDKEMRILLGIFASLKDKKVD